MRYTTIPSYGAKGSLNVSAAFAIAMQKWAEYLSRCQPDPERNNLEGF
jgi:tRNA G18 (ribose-2'-O)-methylase SpoU